MINYEKYLSIGEAKIQFNTIPLDGVQKILDNYFYWANQEFLEVIERIGNHPNMLKIINNGVYLTGGGAKYDYLISKFRFSDNIKQTKSKTPLLDNINGLKKIIADTEKYKKYITVN